MADTKAFYRLLDQLRDIENSHDLRLWYVELSKPSPFGQKEVWDKMSEKDMKLLVKNINKKQNRLEKEEKSKKSALSENDLSYLATVASGEVGKEIFRQINALDRNALMAWGAKNKAIADSGTDIGENNTTIKYDGKAQFDVRCPKFKGRVVIYLMPDDTYTIVFGQIRNSRWNVKKRINGVYNDQLVEIIDDYVG